MQSFNHFLRENGVPSDLRSLLYHIARSVKYINFAIRAGETGKAGSQNSFGEHQLALDVLSDQIIEDELGKSELAKMTASEEQEHPANFPAPRGDFFVAYDPLDGSSLVDANLAIGSIFGIWDKSEEVLGQKVGKNMIASCYSVYGPRITLAIAIKGKGLHEFELNDVGEFMLKQKDLKVSDKSKYFAPGNLRCCNESPKYKSWLDSMISEGKTLRYSGGMVPDVHHIFSKENGLFCYPRDSAHKTGKLRLLFECAPFALAMEEAGGIATDQEGNNILDTLVEDFHQNSPIFIGSKDAVENIVKIMN